MSASINMDLQKLILDLFVVEGVKFGNYTLKSGTTAPVYVDLRVVISYPDLMVTVSEFLWEAGKKAQNDFKTVCGVPYTALPLATCISTKNNIPMLIRRKEAKGYGTKKLIEGCYEEGDKCLIIEDVCTSGSSVLDTVQALNTIGIKVTDAVVLLDRQQGATEILKHHGVALHSVCRLSQVIEILEKTGKIDSTMVTTVKHFISQNQFKPPSNIEAVKKKLLSFGERSKLCINSVSKQLFQIMQEKETNLIVSADLMISTEIIKLLEKVGPHICMVKTHVDIIEDFSSEFVTKLKQLAQKHNFLIFEDSETVKHDYYNYDHSTSIWLFEYNHYMHGKFADIGNTVKLQYKGGIYKISEWADLTNAHCVPGDGVIKGLKEVGLGENRACLLVAEMSSSGNLATGEYTSGCVKIAEENKDFVIGFICQKKLSDNPTFIHMTPGVKLESGNDSLGQQYLTPQEVIGNHGNDVIIVGRGITQAPDVVQAAIAYKQAGYQAYCQLLE